MRYIILFAIILPLIYGSGCKQSPPAYNYINTENGAWELVWNDEFDYEGLPDEAKWNFDTAGNEWGWGNNEAQWYTAGDRENALVNKGVLSITARREDMNGKRYTSARLTSKSKGDWEYGRIEVRAKLPEGNGTWSAIWMLPTGNAYGDWPHSGEIDIMEHVGYDPDSIYSTVHTEKYNHLANTEVGNIARCYTPGEYHIYSMEWDENEIRSYIDDEHYFTFRNDGEGHQAWPFDQEFHLIVNLAIGGNWGGRQGIDDSLFPHTMEIDYVRVYKKMPKRKGEF